MGIGQVDSSTRAGYVACEGCVAVKLRIIVGDRSGDLPKNAPFLWCGPGLAVGPRHPQHIVLAIIIGNACGLEKPIRQAV